MSSLRLGGDKLRKNKKYFLSQEENLKLLSFGPWASLLWDMLGY